MAKLTLTDVTAGYELTTTVNANNTAIENAIENTLSRDGTAPNTMTANFDMNSNKIVNLTDGVNNQDAVTVAQLTGAQLGASPAALNVSVTDTGAYYTGADVETVLAEIATLFLKLSGGTMSGNIAMADNEIQRAELKDYSVTSSSPSSSSNSITLDCTNGNAFQTTLTENITTVTLSNPPASGNYGEIIWKIIQDSTARTVTFPASVKWPGGTAPTISTASGAVDIVVLKTWDAGTTWYGEFAQAYA